MKFVVAVWTLAQLVCLTLGQCVPNNVCNKCNRKLELGIILDSSRSIPPEDFKKAKDFLQEYLKKFNIGQDRTRVSIVTYGRTVHTQDVFNLATYDSTEEVVRAIGDIPHREGDYTATGKAINFMRERQLGSQNVRRDVPRVAVVLTDGNSQDTKITADEARKAREQGINIFAVGIGQSIDDQELLNIAGRNDRVNRVYNYSKLNTIVDWLAKVTCVRGS